MGAWMSLTMIVPTGNSVEPCGGAWFKNAVRGTSAVWTHAASSPPPSAPSPRSNDVHDAKLAKSHGNATNVPASELSPPSGAQPSSAAHAALKNQRDILDVALTAIGRGRGMNVRDDVQRAVHRTCRGVDGGEREGE